jgi:hypothetical protein
MLECMDRSLPRCPCGRTATLCVGSKTPCGKAGTNLRRFGDPLRRSGDPLRRSGAPLRRGDDPLRRCILVAGPPQALAGAARTVAGPPQGVAGAARGVAGAPQALVGAARTVAGAPQGFTCPDNRNDQQIGGRNQENLRREPSKLNLSMPSMESMSEKSFPCFCSAYALAEPSDKV